jgi:uncharacterized protein CbrC (UPF0167 family)
MADDWMRRYVELAKGPAARAPDESLAAMYALIEEMKGIEEAKSVLWLAYKWLGLYQSAYEIFAGMYDPDDRKQQKTLRRLKEEACSRGDRFAVKRPGVEKKGTLGDKLPAFRYFPDPFGCEAFEKAGEGEEIVCPCCGKATEYYYPRMYCVEDVKNLCPECVASGRAAKKYDGCFVQDVEPVSDAEKTRELFERTPGYVSWQGEHWLAHCDDYMAYLGDVGRRELEAMGILDEVVEEYAHDDEYGEEDVREYLEAKGSMSGYLFRCLHCGKYRIWVDAD